MKRKQHPPEFKAKVALAARFGVHPIIIYSWNGPLWEKVLDLFNKGHKSRQDIEFQIDELYDG